MSTRQTICRNASPKNPYTPICNVCLQDYSLSLDAHGFLVRFLSMPSDWSASLDWAKKEFHLGEQKAERIIKELIARGYARKSERLRRPDGTWGPVLYEFTDVPFTFETPMEPSHSVKTRRVDDHAVESHAVANHSVKTIPHTKETVTKETLDKDPPTPLQGVPRADLFEAGEQPSGARLANARRRSREELLPYTANYERAWALVPEREGMSKKAGFKSWLEQDCEPIAELVIAGVKGWAEQRRIEGTKRDPAKIKHFQGWLTDRRWESFEEPAAQAQADPQKERKLQVMALAMDLADRTWTHAVKWWRSRAEVPADILADAERHQYEFAAAA
jgi:hypothetical protein